MITREYTCKECGHILEEQVSIKSPVRTNCGVCGGMLRQKYGQPLVQFFNSPYFYDGQFHRHPKIIGENQFNRSYRFHGTEYGKNA